MHWKAFEPLAKTAALGEHQPQSGVTGLRQLEQSWNVLQIEGGVAAAPATRAATVAFSMISSRGAPALRYDSMGRSSPCAYDGADAPSSAQIQLFV